MTPRRLQANAEDEVLMRVFVMGLCSLILCSGFAHAAGAQAGVAAGGSGGGASAGRLGAVGSIIQQAVGDHNIPGAVLVGGDDGEGVYRKGDGAGAAGPRRQ